MSNRKIRLEDHVLFVKNLPFQVTSKDMHDLFGQYGAIRQIRIGNEPKTNGTGFVVYEDPRDAKVALDKLSGYSMQNRYLVVLPYAPEKATSTTEDIETRRMNLEELKREHGIN